MGVILCPKGTMHLRHLILQACQFHLAHRPPNLRDGSTAVTAPQGADPLPVGAAGASAQTSCSPGGVEPASPSVCRTRAGSPAADSLYVFRKRSIFNFNRRTSSGYFSFEGDSLPGSPLSPKAVTADRATQTPSPTGQVLKHALQRMAEAHGGVPGTRVQHAITSSSCSRFSRQRRSLSPSSTQQRNAARDMQREEVGRELRRIGDEYNRHLLLRPTVYKSHGSMCFSSLSIMKFTDWGKSAAGVWLELPVAE
ncbi:hypothetical protein JOQ06_020666, partial [Pogonophryne albipinna]